MAKITLNDVRKTKEVKLPKTGATVVIFSSLLTGDLMNVSQTESDIENGINVLIRAIKSWDIYLSESDAEPMAINKDNLKKLPMEDFVVLQKEFTDFFGEEKKS